MNHAPQTRGEASPSPIPPAGTLILCLLTLGTAVVQSCLGWERVSQAIGIVRSYISLTELGSVRSGQMLPVWLTLITYVFPHGGWWHVLPNMTGFWLFGAIAERRVGTVRFVAGYFLAGVIGAFCYGLVVLETSQPLAGASLAIAGLAGAYASARRLEERQRTQSPGWLEGVLELAAVVGVIGWLTLRQIPERPDLLSSVMYHFLPFLTLWLLVQLVGRCGRLWQRRRGRGA